MSSVCGKKLGQTLPPIEASSSAIPSGDIQGNLERRKRNTPFQTGQIGNRAFLTNWTTDRQSSRTIISSRTTFNGQFWCVRWFSFLPDLTIGQPIRRRAGLLKKRCVWVRSLIVEVVVPLLHRLRTLHCLELWMDQAMVNLLEIKESSIITIRRILNEHMTLLALWCILLLLLHSLESIERREYK